MTSTTDYKGARTATPSAAKDLYGATSPEFATVAEAWSTVNVLSRTDPPPPPTRPIRCSRPDGQDRRLLGRGGPEAVSPRRSCFA
ncbi:M4 family metallopeptidase [Streptomyces sp. NPDC002521]